MIYYETTQEISAAAREQLHRNAGWFFGLGISLVALGLAALYFSYASTLISVVYIGLFLIISGIFEVIQSIQLSRWTSFFLHLFLGIFYTIGGGLIVSHPLLSELQITLVISFFFIVSGVVKTIFSLTHHMVNKNWRIVDGLISLLLGILILSEWPESGLWVIGSFLGITLLVNGLTWIMLSYAFKKPLH